MNKTSLLSICAAIVMLLSSNLTKAADHVTFSLMNATKTSNTIEFDVFIVNDGTSTLNLGGYQFGINYSTSILNGGTPGSTAFTYIAGTRDAVFSTLTNPSVQYSNSQMKVVASLVPYAGSAPLPIGTPYRLGRFKFTNTVNWTSGSVPNLQFQLVSAAGKTNTIALCYINNSVTSTTFNGTNSLLTGSSSAVSLLTLNIPLPVSLASFTGVQEGENDILKWSTLQEENNSHFNLQHSTDGVNFSTIATLSTLAENGNSNQILNYQFTNMRPIQGHNYYRLEQVDIDGKSSIEGDIIDLIRTDKASEISFYPNPARDMIHITIVNTSASNTTVQLTDMNGRIVKRSNQLTNAGTELISLNTQDVSNGNYVLQVIQNNKGLFTSHVQIRN